MAIINGNNTIFATLNGNQFFIDSALDVDASVYGWHVDPTISDSTQAITYLADAVGKTPASMGASSFSYGDWSDAFFMPKPCMLKYDGTVDYYLDPNDYTKKADGTASDIADPNYGGNAMMEWPLIWYKFEAGTAEGEGYFYCSNNQVDSSYKCWCNYDSHNNIIPHFYTAIYNTTYHSSKQRSLSGYALTPANGNGGQDYDTEVVRATRNNTTSAIEWYTEVFADRMLISALLILMGKSLNNQAVFGRGLDTGSQAAKESYVSGTLNDKGLFWGSTSVGTSGVKVFGMENYWGCVMHRVAGLVGAWGLTYKYKLTCNTADGSSAVGYNKLGEQYLSTAAFRPNTDGYITKMTFGDHGMLPSAVESSSSGYYNVYYYEGDNAALFGGMTDNANNAGSLNLNLYTSANVTSTYIEGSLSCKPIAGA